MRNIHSCLTTQYGKESVEIYWRWEKYKYKMVDFQNHRHFSLRCLSKDITPTSVRLKSTIRTPKAKYIIKRAERALLNERIRSINNTIAMFENLRDTCINQLEAILDKEIMEECREFIEIRRERRHLSTLERHLSKFRRLCHEKSGGHSKLWHGTQGENSGNTCTTTCITTSTSTSTIPEDDKQDGHPGARVKRPPPIPLVKTGSETCPKNLN